MKKIPTLFKRIFDNHKLIGITPDVTPGCEWVLEGKGDATIKFDGSCCAVIDGKFYKRFDAKKGKKVPDGAIPCCDPDPVTGSHPHWVLVDENRPDDKWFVEAYKNEVAMKKAKGKTLENGTYEAVGPHFQGNPYDYVFDMLNPHGVLCTSVERTFEGIRSWLEEHDECEGLVFWLNGEPRCKIKRKDFGFEWPVK